VNVDSTLAEDIRAMLESHPETTPNIPQSAQLMSTSPSLPEQAVASQIFIFQVDDIISHARCLSAVMMGDRLLEKITRLPFSQVSSLQGDAKKIFTTIIGTQAVDPLPLKSRVQKYIDDVKNYLSIQDAFGQRMTSTAHTQHRAKLQCRLDAALFDLNHEKNALTLQRSELSDIQSKRTMLNEELKCLEAEEEGFVSSILHGKNIVKEKDIPVTNAENELFNLELI